MSLLLSELVTFQAFVDLSYLTVFALKASSFAMFAAEMGVAGGVVGWFSLLLSLVGIYGVFGLCNDPPNYNQDYC